MHTCCPILKKSFLFSKDDSAPYSPPGMFILYPHPRACLKKAFCKMCVTICGRFRPDEGAVAGYGNRIRVKYTAKWGMQIAGMIFQTRSKPIDVLTASKRILPFPGRKGGALAAGTSIIVLYVFFKDSFTSQVFRFFS